MTHGIGEFLSVFGIQPGLVVEQIHLRRTAGLIEKNNPLGFGGEMGTRQQCPRIEGGNRIDQIGQGEPAEAHAEFV